MQDVFLNYAYDPFDVNIRITLRQIKHYFSFAFIMNDSVNFFLYQKAILCQYAYAYIFFYLKIELYP